MAPIRPIPQENSIPSSPGFDMDPLQNVPFDISNVSWPDIFSRHESNLHNHVELCAMLRQYVMTDSDASRGLLGIIGRTQDLMKELGRLRSEFISHGLAGRVLSGQNANKVDQERETQSNLGLGTGNSSVNNPMESGDASNPGPTPESPPVFVFDTKPTPVTMPQRPKNKKKRFHDDDVSDVKNPRPADPEKASKRRKKNDIPDADADHSQQHQQVSACNPQSKPPVEFEDISDEVERRLKLREERWRKRNLPPQKKRKRDSGGSTVAEESATPKPKRIRSGNSPSESENAVPTPGKEKRRVSAETSEAEGRSVSHSRKKTKRSKGGQT